MKLIDYCKYNDGDHPHRARKRTCIWTNTAWEPARALCKKDCGYCDEQGRRLDYARRVPRDGRPRHSVTELYTIPAALPRELWGFMEGENDW